MRNGMVLQMVWGVGATLSRYGYWKVTSTQLTNDTRRKFDSKATIWWE